MRSVWNKIFDLIGISLKGDKLPPYIMTPRSTNGVGLLYCSSCSYEERVIFYSHGFNPDKRNEDGSLIPVNSFKEQCQKCGKLHYYNYLKPKESLECNCGGLITDEDPVFCPDCRHINMRYHMQFMT
jgi:hypothetical protein